MTDAQRQARVVSELKTSRASTTEGQVTGIDWGARLVTVNIGGFTQVMPWKGAPPWEGDRVRIDTQGGLPVCALIEGAPYGTVLSIAGDYLNVLGDDGVRYRYAFLASETYAGGELVALDHARRVVLGLLSTDPVFDAPAPVPGGPPGGVRSAWFNPAWSGNWSSGAFSSDFVTISSTRVGAYGFGAQIRDTIPDSAAIIRAELHLTQNWDNVPGVASSMGVHGFDGRPGSMTNAQLTGTTSVPGGSRAVDIRGGVIGALVTGGALGVGFRSGSSGWREYDRAPASGRVYVEWQG